MGVCAMLCTVGPARAAPAPELGSAASFAVLGGTAVANSGTTRVVGNVGVSPGKAVSGLRSEDVSVGDIYRDDAVARRAQRDAGAAWDELARGTCIELTVLAGTIRPGVYCVASSSMPLSGTLAMDAAGDAKAVWIFRMSSLTTAAGSSVITIGGGQDRNVFWRVDGAAALGERTAFVGNILASSSITLKTGATLSGRALARNGAVTLDSNKVSACCEPVTLVQTSLPDASAGAIYRQKIDASGGAGEYTFAKISGSLPEGLTLSVDGIVSGTPVARGGYPITVMATDRNGCSGARAYTIVVGCAGAILLSPGELPGGTVGSDYKAIIKATGGTGSYAFSVGETKLPPGLRLTETGDDAGLLSGTPTAPGPYTFTVTAEDTVTHCFGSRTYTVTIAPIICALTIAPDALPNATLGMPYSETVMASGGSGSYVFTVAGLPDGLPPDGLLPAGTIAGTPTVACLHEVTVTVTDTITGCFTSRKYTLAVCPLTLSPLTLPDGTVGIEYPPTTIRPDCGSEIYTFEVTEPYPPGLTLPPEISGAPTTAGSYTFTVTGRDSTTGCIGSRTYTVKICPKITIRASLPDGDVGIDYGETIVSGGKPDYTFDVRSGSFPPGLGPLPDGTLGGTPTAEGQYFVRIRVTDANGCTAEGDVEIEIDGAPPMAGPVVPLSGWAMTLLSVVLAMAGFFAIRRSWST
ncbi:MAG: ice-binding family protein [Acidobacteriota bacterium]|nr:ice-binding family protein [Acidobacteriota bacterium]